MAEEIQISDIRPIRIKYDKLGASIRKMADDFIQIKYKNGNPSDEKFEF